MCLNVHKGIFMSDELSDNQPLPVLPLDYFQPSRDSWRPMVRAMIWLSLLFEGYDLVSYAVEVACYFWQTTLPNFSAYGIRGIPIAVHVPMQFASLIILIGSVDSLKLIDSGRRWIVGGSLMMLVVVPVTEIWNAFYYTVINEHWRYGVPYVVMYLLRYLLAGVGGCIWPAFVWKFFRRSEVLAVFHQRHLPQAEA
jgi:hypothetical protein